MNPQQKQTPVMRGSVRRESEKQASADERPVPKRAPRMLPGCEARGSRNPQEGRFNPRKPAVPPSTPPPAHLRTGGEEARGKRTERHNPGGTSSQSCSSPGWGGSSGSGSQKNDRSRLTEDAEIAWRSIEDDVNEMSKKPRLIHVGRRRYG